MHADRDILFGALAVELGLIDPARLAEAGCEWRGHPERPLADLIVGKGWITDAERAALETRIERDLSWAEGESATITPPPVAATSGVVRTRRPPGDRPPDHATDLQSGPGSDPDPGTLTAGSSETVPWSSTADAVAPPVEPPRVAPRYRIGGLHGRGGIGRVWVAHDVRIGREVALKELRPDRAGYPEMAARFVQEARITGQLEHPGIVPVYELVEADGDGRPYYAMRLIRGRTLVEAAHEYHRTRHPSESPAATARTLRDLLGAFVAVANAVAYAHSRGVIHRDLKGQNVILGDFGVVMVVDWGLARVNGKAEDDGRSARPIDLEDGFGRDATLPGRAIGTPAFMSPEQARGETGAVGPRSDVYGLGAILYQILTDRSPFEGPAGEVIRRVLTEAPPSPRSIRPETPRALEAICLKAMAKDPEDRYAGATDLAADVQHWLADEPVTAARDPWPTRLRRLARRHRAAVTGLATLLGAGVVALAVGYVLVGQQKDRAERARKLAEHNSIIARSALQQIIQRFADSRLVSNDPQFQQLRIELARLSSSQYRSLLGADPENPDLRRAAADVLWRSANVFRWSSRLDEADRNYAEAIRLLEGLIQSDPGDPAPRAELASVLIDAAESQEARAKFDAAEPLYLRAVALTTELCRVEPRSVAYRRRHGLGLEALAEIRSVNGQRDEALRLIDEAVALQETLVRGRSIALIDRLLLAGSRTTQGKILRQAGQLAEAESAVRRAIDLAEALVAEQPREMDFRFFLAQAQLERGRLLARDPARASEARATLVEVIEKFERLTAAHPDSRRDQKYLAEARAEFEKLPHAATAGVGPK